MRNRAGLAQADDAGNIERAGTHAALMAAAIDNGRDLNPGILAAYIQRSHAFGPIHFVTRYRSQVDVLLDDIDWNLANRLGRVGVENDSALMTELTDFCHRLQHSDFVVGKH